MSASTSKSTPTTPSKSRTSNLLSSHSSSLFKENDNPESPSVRSDSRREDRALFPEPAKGGDGKASMPILNNDPPSRSDFELLSQGRSLSAAESCILIRSELLEALREKGQGQFVSKYLENPNNDRACWNALERCVGIFHPNQRIWIELDDLRSHHVFEAMVNCVLPAIIINAAGDVAHKGLEFDVSLNMEQRHWKSVFSLMETIKNSGSDYVPKIILKNFSEVQAALSPIFNASSLEKSDQLQIFEAVFHISLLVDDHSCITASPKLVVGLNTASLKRKVLMLLNLSKKDGALPVFDILNSIKASLGSDGPAPTAQDVLELLQVQVDQQKERINQAKLKQDSSKSPASQEAQHLGAGLPGIESSSSTTSAVTGPTGISEPQGTPAIKKSHPRPESSPREVDPITGQQAPKSDGHIDQRSRLESSSFSSTPIKSISTNATSSASTSNELLKSQGGQHDVSFELDPLQSSSPSVRLEKRSEAGKNLIQVLQRRSSNDGSGGGLFGGVNLKSKSGNLQSSSSSGPSSSSSPLNPSRSQHPIVSAHEYLKSDAFYRSKQNLDSGENQLSVKEQIAGFESASESGADTEYETQSDSSKTQTEEHEDSQTGDENESGDEDSEGRNGEESESENEEELGDRNDEETGSVDTEDLESAVNAAMISPPNSQQSSTSNSNSGGFRFVRPEETNRRRAETQESNSSQASLSSHWNVWPELKRDMSDLSEDETGSQRSGGTARERQEEEVQDQVEDEGGVGGGLEIERLEDDVGAPAGNDDLQDEA